MMWRRAAALAALAVSACTTVPAQRSAPPVEVQILAFNDFHGNLETPPPVEITEADGSTHTITSGGAAHLAAALAGLRAGHAETVTVSAGDTIGASPLISANYLDEPTIDAMNLLGLEFNAVGNHEFDKGIAELKRMQSGGCARNSRRAPCAIEPFTGARFHYLAANVVQADGTTVFPATGIKRFQTPSGPISIGFIGMTLKGTKHLVTPSGVQGVTFTDEAETANALVPKLKAEGADAIVLLIHQGGKLPQFTAGNGCDGLYGDILPILPRLDPAIATVISGHSHWAYVCRETAAVAGRLLTSAGKYGYFVTNLRLRFDPSTHRLIGQDAANVMVGNGERGDDPAVKALVQRYATAIAPVANQVIGRLTATATKDGDESEGPAADLVADSMLAATNGGAQIALVNATGIRVDLPGGDVKYKDAFTMMPFGNNLVVMSLTGAQLKAVLEQQYAVPLRPNKTRPAALAPSAGFTYAVDIRRPEGGRVSDLRLAGKPIDPATRYRVVVNNYLASGGDGLTGFTAGTEVTDTGMIDVDALVAWIAKGQSPPTPNRIRFAS
jgi:5'-nucleotidase